MPGYRAPVSLVTVLELEQSKGFAAGQPEQTRYLIRSQNDCYQVDAWLKFVSPLRLIWLAFIAVTFVSSFVCVFSQAVCWPFVRYEERLGQRKAHQDAERIEAEGDGNGGDKKGT